MTSVNEIHEMIFKARDMIWSGPLVFLLVLAGLYLTWQLKGLQFRYLARALKMVICK